VTSRSTARYTLAAIRLFNGGAALSAPEQLARRLGDDPQTDGAVIYVLRMFGIRTLVIGTELLVLRRHPRLAGVAGAAAALGAGLATGALLRRDEGAGPPAAGHRQSLPWRLYDGAAEVIDRRVGWDKLPTPLGLAVLVGLRNTLRKRNLYDTSAQPAVNTPPVGPPDPRNLTRRTVDGTYNDLEHPSMGMAGSRFGRNIPIEHTFPDPNPLEPSPREVSRVLLTRHELVPATSVNALVAAWLQWMIRDWFSHGRSPTDNPWRIPLADDGPTRPARPGPATCPPPTPTPRHPGGTAPRSTARRPSSSGSCAPASTASSGSAPTGWYRCRPTPTTTRPWSRASGSGWPCCRGCSPSSTTRSATGCGPSTRRGPTTSCSRRPGWSTRP
jgi:Animal haem peroxidase